MAEIRWQLFQDSGSERYMLRVPLHCKRLCVYVLRVSEYARVVDGWAIKMRGRSLRAMNTSVWLVIF